MATFVKRKDKQWQARIRKKGYAPLSKTFKTKAAAQQWASEIELEIDKGLFVSKSDAETRLVKEFLTRYLIEEVPKMKSFSSHKSNIKLLDDYFGHLALNALTPALIREYRDKRLDYVKGDTVRKNISLLGRVIKHAITEWDVHLPFGNPVNAVKLPPKGKSRNRRLMCDEEEILLKTAKEYDGVIEPIIRIAIETAARRGEIQRLCWQNINFKESTANLLDTKNGEDREIPLSEAALHALKSLPRSSNGSVFNMQTDSITQAFRMVCQRAGIEDLWFHDLRHEATSRFFELGLSIMEVSTITGHKDLRMLRNYTHLNAKDLVAKINSGRQVL